MNDGMGAYVASQLIKGMITKSILIESARVLVMGLAFKENCPDLRNTRVVDIVAELDDYNCTVDVYDPWVDKTEAQAEYGLTVIEKLQPGNYDAIMLAVAHNEFKSMGAKTIRMLGKNNCLIYDLKYLFTADEVDLRL